MIGPTRITWVTPPAYVLLPAGAGSTTVLGGTVVYRRDADAAAPSLTRATPAYHQRGTDYLAGGNCCCQSMHSRFAIRAAPIPVWSRWQEAFDRLSPASPDSTPGSITVKGTHQHDRQATAQCCLRRNRGRRWRDRRRFRIIRMSRFPRFGKDGPEGPHPFDQERWDSTRPRTSQGLEASNPWDVLTAMQPDRCSLCTRNSSSKPSPQQAQHSLDHEPRGLSAAAPQAPAHVAASN